MEDAAALIALAVDRRDDVRAGQTAVQDDRQARFGGRGQLAPQGFALGLGRGKVIMIVEPDLADRSDRAAGGQVLDRREVAGREVLGLVGVHASRGQDGRELRAERREGGQACGTGQIARAEDGDDPGREGPAHGLGPVGVELRHVEMGVRIDEARLRVHEKEGDTYRGGTCPRKRLYWAILVRRVRSGMAP